MTTCPECGGNRTLYLHVHGMRDGRSFGEWRERACDECDGTGEVSDERAEALASAELLRVSRISRGMSLREEAQRLGITPRELNDREHGRGA